MDQGSAPTARWRRRLLIGLASLVGVVGVAMSAWAIAIGPVEVWRVLTHGTTTVWDHLEYPGRDLRAAMTPVPVPAAAATTEPTIVWDGKPTPLADVLLAHDSLSFLVLRDGEIEYQWYAPGHDPATATMLFSVSKSIVSLLVGAAIEDGLIGSVDDPVTTYIPELEAGGFGTITIEDLLLMRSNSTYVEDDNPFGIHVEFNYSADLTHDILGLRTRDDPSEDFAYRSGDNAILGLVLDRVLAPRSITDYLQERFLDPMGAEHPGRWSTDTEGGLERTWCCLALATTDLARFGLLIAHGGIWDGAPILDDDWTTASTTNAYVSGGWPAEYDDSDLDGYGYQWWIVDGGAVLALGKDGQYLYIDPTADVVVVRTGTSQGGIRWLPILLDVAG